MKEKNVIHTPNGPIDLGGLCLKNDTMNGKPLLEMKEVHQSINYKVLFGMIATVFALGVIVPACNKCLENVTPNYSVPHAVVHQTPTPDYLVRGNIRYK